MLRRLHARGFKSLVDVGIELPRLAVLFGPNAAGKSNVLDALQALSRIATERTLKDALAPPIRGYPSEVFTLPEGGLAELSAQRSATFTLEADVTTRPADREERFRYRIGVQLAPSTGALTTADEWLTRLTRNDEPTGTPRIERQSEDQLVVRANRQGHPRYHRGPLNHALLSDPTLTRPYYRDIEVVRDELTSWRSYYLDPSVAMRDPRPPSEVRDIGARGDAIAPFLHHLKQTRPRSFEGVVRAVRQVVPSITTVDVELDARRGTLDLTVIDNGVPYSSRVVSEGTLRILALACIALSPYPAGLVAFEEPENGVHPRRADTIAQFLLSAAQRSQVVVTTHSPAFLAEMLRLQRERPDAGVGLLAFRQGLDGTEVSPFPDPGPLLADPDIRTAFQEPDEERLLETLYVHGWLDG